MTRFGMQVSLAHPPKYDLIPEVVELAKKNAAASDFERYRLETYKIGPTPIGLPARTRATQRIVISSVVPPCSTVGTFAQNVHPP